MARHKYEAYYKKTFGGIEKGRGKPLVVTMNKIKIKNPKSSLINNIWNPPNSPRNYAPEITDSGDNIHLENESTQSMSPVIM